MLMVYANFRVAHARYYTIHMSGVKSNPISGFRVPMFPIHYVTFVELSEKNNGCFLLTPMLSSSHYRLTENGFWG